MIDTKAWTAQVKSILQARKKAGRKYGLEIREASGIPQGALCFLPEVPMHCDMTEEELWKAIEHEPLFIASDDADMYVLLRSNGDLVTPLDATQENSNWLVSDPANPEYKYRNEYLTDTTEGQLFVVVQCLSTSIQDAVVEHQKSEQAKAAAPANKPQELLFL
jgi:hypothetical protein